MGEELGRGLERVDHAGRFVHHDDTGRARHRARRDERVEVHGDVDLIRGEHLRRDSAGNDRLELLSVAHSLRVGLDELSESYAHGSFVETRAIHVAAQREESRASLLGSSDFGELGGALPEDVRNAGKRLDVVHDGRALKEPRDRGEGRLQLGKPLSALEGAQERGLFAADVGARAAVDHDVEIEPASLDVLSEPPLRVRFLDRATQALRRSEILAADVDVRLVAPDGEGGDDHSFEESVGIPLQDVTILERPRLALVRVHHQILRLGAVLGNEGPLSRCGESRAAQAAEVRLSDFLDDRGGRHRERLLRRLVAAVLHVRVEPGPFRVFESRRENRPVGRDVGLGLAGLSSNEAFERSAIERPDELLVELRHRRDLTGAETLDFRQGQLAVRRRLARTDRKPLLDLVEDIVRSPEKTWKAGADPELALSRGGRAVHRVERDDLAHVGDGRSHEGADPALRLGRDPAEVFLHEPEEGKSRRAALVVALKDFFRFRFEFGEVHRSSSPPIMFTEPNVGTTSAIIPPTRSFGSADMMAKQGGRTRTR